MQFFYFVVTTIETVTSVINCDTQINQASTLRKFVLVTTSLQRHG